MQDITVFCNYSCLVPTDTLGLYYSVNRQDMKLDRVSVFCYNKRCRLRVKMQWNSIYFACCSTKRNTLTFSVCCQSKLLAADCWLLDCPEMLSSKCRSRDDFDQILKSWEYVSGKAMQVECWNSMTVSFSRWPIGTKHYKN